MNNKKILSSKDLNENLLAFALLLPSLIPLCVFWVYPMMMTFYLSFTDWNYISPQYNFVGMENYVELFGSSFFYQVLKNTLVFTLGTVIPPLMIGIILALLLVHIKKGKGIFLCGIFSSWITPVVIVSTVWVGMFEKDTGIINQVIQFLGGEPVPWLWQGNTAMLAVIIVTVWQYMGISTLLLASTMTKIDPSVYEAAALDGAKGLRKFFSITFPEISPTVFFLIILFLLDSLKAYDQIYILTQGGPSGATSSLLYYFYVVAFQWFETGSAAAVAIVIVCVCLLISGINFLYSKKWVRY